MGDEKRVEEKRGGREFVRCPRRKKEMSAPIWPTSLQNGSDSEVT